MQSQGCIITVVLSQWTGVYSGEGFTALFRAAERGLADIIELLLQSRASINASRNAAVLRLMQHFIGSGPSLRISIANVHARFGAYKHEFCKQQTACAPDKVADAVSPEGAFYREEEDSCNACVGAYRMPGTLQG